MPTTREKAKAAKRKDIIFRLLEVACVVGILYYFSDTSANELVHRIFHDGSGSGRRGGPKSKEDKERDRYIVERDFEYVNAIRIGIVIMISVVILVEFVLEIFAMTRFNKAVEMSESNPQEALKMVACYINIHIIMGVIYILSFFLLPAGVIRVVCDAKGDFMVKLREELKTGDQIVPGMNPVFGEGRDDVIRTLPPSDSESSRFPGSSSESSQIKTV